MYITSRAKNHSDIFTAHAASDEPLRTVAGALIAGHAVAGRTRADERTVSVLADSETHVMTSVSRLTALVDVCIARASISQDYWGRT